MAIAQRMAAADLCVSVVAPTHHRVALLRKLLTSLEQQSLPVNSFEVIVVGDEGDPGANVVAEFAERSRLNIRFSFVPDDPWRGKSPSLKRNHGVSLARAPWVAFIDDDCVADPRWLEEALPFFDDERNGGVEGQKIIPRLDPPTLTYKGLLLFTRPRGYQTANMFYRRSVFQAVGGFDTAFPFYLEDTDLAWSVLERDLAIPHAERAVVEHPVPPAEPMRLLASAKRAILMPYLCKKHPASFRAAKMRTIARGHYPYLTLYGCVGVAALAGRPLLAGALLGSVVPLVAAHAHRLFRGCAFTSSELLQTASLLPVVPVITLVQLLRGNFKHGVWLTR